MFQVTSPSVERAVAAADALLAGGRIVDAGNGYRAVLCEWPEHVGALRGFAVCADSVGNWGLAEKLSRAALAQDERHAGTWLIAGHALLMLGLMTGAKEAYGRAGQLEECGSCGAVGLALAHYAAGEIEAALAVLEDARGRWPDDHVVCSTYLFLLNYAEGRSAAAVFEEHRRWGERHGLPAARFGNARETEKVLRIGYVSPDFRRHPVAMFLEPVLAHHDRARVEVFCYATDGREDGVTERLRSLVGPERWRSIARLNDAAAEGVVRRDQIDVLVDLAGHTAGDRLRLFARKPAPVQVTYLGYPNSTGLRAMDYRLTDAAADPVGLTEHLHTEKLWRLSACFLCFVAPQEWPEVGELPALRKGHVTFGSFNTLAKVNERVIGVWARVLRRVAGARLCLKAPAFADAALREQWRRRFEQHGITGNRLDFLPFVARYEAHLRKYAEVDVALDTFAYAGTTTTCEALAMGVPVVTLAGDCHRARVGASLLEAAGHGEWAAADEDAYVEIAARLAGDLGRLAEIRRGLRGELRTSRLADAAGFTGALEQAYREMWREWCAKEA